MEEITGHCLGGRDGEDNVANTSYLASQQTSNRCINSRNKMLKNKLFSRIANNSKAPKKQRNKLKTNENNKQTNLSTGCQMLVKRCASK